MVALTSSRSEFTVPDNAIVPVRDGVTRISPKWTVPECDANDVTIRRRTPVEICEDTNEIPEAGRKELKESRVASRLTLREAYEKKRVPVLV